MEEPQTREQQPDELYGFKSSKALKKSLKQLASTTVFSNLDFDRPNPDHSISISTASTHTAPQVVVDTDKMTVTNAKGYAMARATHGFESGSWYFEVEYVEAPAEGFVRLGLAQILAEGQAPVGYDEFSYGLRNKDGAVMHCGWHRDCCEPFGQGDTVGVLVNLPATDPTTAPLDESLREAIEKACPPKRLTSYKVRQDILADPSQSSIHFLVNGQDSGPAFQNIYRGKYYPAVTCYRGASVRFNFGPDFKFPLPEGAQPACLIHSSPVGNHQVVNKD